MADIVTGTVSGQVDMTSVQAQLSDIRREAEVAAGVANLENMKGFDRVNSDVLKSAWQTTDATKDARHDVTDAVASQAALLSRQIDAIDDTLSASVNQVSRDVTDNRAQISAIGYQIRDGFFSAGKDSEINALKTQVDAAKNTTYLSDKIGGEGEKTRLLINELQSNDLNRMLIERNALLAEAYADGRHARDRVDMGQFAAVNSQIQALHSQLSTQLATQGTVNFGSMSGNAGRNTSTNNVV